MNASLERLRGSGYPAVFCLGHPDYYPRFGFERTDKKGIVCEYEAPPEAFMLLELRPGALEGWRGTMHYQPEFQGV
jgi:putative acetyltransferase